MVQIPHWLAQRPAINVGGTVIGLYNINSIGRSTPVLVGLLNNPSIKVIVVIVIIGSSGNARRRVRTGKYAIHQTRGYTRAIDGQRCGENERRAMLRRPDSLTLASHVRDVLDATHNEAVLPILPAVALHSCRFSVIGTRFSPNCYSLSLSADADVSFPAPAGVQYCKNCKGLPS